MMSLGVIIDEYTTDPLPSSAPVAEYAAGKLPDTVLPSGMGVLFLLYAYFLNQAIFPAVRSSIAISRSCFNFEGDI